MRTGRFGKAMSDALFSLQGKVALITGASKEMGQGVAYTLAEHGADVALTARTAAQLDDLAARIRKLGRKTVAIPADLRNIDGLASIVDRTVAELGGLDILVNLAGSSEFADFGWALTMTQQQWDNMVDLNLKAPMFLSQAAAKVMKERGGGSIVNISSGVASSPAPRMSNYGAAKAGLENLSKTLSQEWARFGIRVNVVVPGVVDVEHTRKGTYNTPEREAMMRKAMPLGRFGEPMDIAGAVLYMVSPVASWVSGAILHVDGGTTNTRPFG
jgi:NAD(P)-dependent dehydrogenase (short-subunit alcohol dehydrogenase family)